MKYGNKHYSKQSEGGLHESNQNGVKYMDKRNDSIKKMQRYCAGKNRWRSIQRCITKNNICNGTGWI